MRAESSSTWRVSPNDASRVPIFGADKPRPSSQLASIDASGQAKSCDLDFSALLLEREL